MDGAIFVSPDGGGSIDVRTPGNGAAGHVEVLGLGIDHALFASEQKAYGKQRCVADHVLQLFEAIWRFADQGTCWQQRIGTGDELRVQRC